MVFFQQPYADIVYEEAKKLVIVTYKKYLSSEQLREVYEKTLECTINYGATKILNDASTFVTIKAADQEWISSNYVSRIVHTKIKKIATVLPDNMIQKQVLNKIESDVDKTRLPFESQNFQSLEAAMQWLRN